MDKRASQGIRWSVVGRFACRCLASKLMSLSKSKGGFYG